MSFVGVSDLTSVIKTIALVDSFHDFGKHPLKMTGVRGLLRTEIAQVKTQLKSLTIFEGSSDIENKLHAWLVSQKKLPATSEEDTSYEMIQMQAKSKSLLWPTLVNKLIIMGRTGNAKEREKTATMIFRENVDKQRENFHELVTEAMSWSKQVGYVIDRTYVPEEVYCSGRPEQSGQIVWGGPSEYDHLMKVDDKAANLPMCIAPSNKVITLTKADGFLVELDIAVISSVPSSITYTRANHGSFVIDIHGIISTKNTVPKSLTLFKKCIEIVQGGRKRKRKLEELILDVELTLKEQFGLEPPSASNTDAYIRALFDFKRIMDFGQVLLAKEEGAIFVTHDRVAALLARVLQVPTIHNKLKGEDDELEEENEHRSKGIVLYPVSEGKLSESDKKAVAEKLYQKYWVPLQSIDLSEQAVAAFDASMIAFANAVKPKLASKMTSYNPTTQKLLSVTLLKKFVRFAEEALVLLKCIYARMLMHEAPRMLKTTMANVTYEGVNKLIHALDLQLEWVMRTEQPNIDDVNGNLGQIDEQGCPTPLFVKAAQGALFEDIEASWWTTIEHLTDTILRNSEDSIRFHISKSEVYNPFDDIKRRLVKLFGVSNRWLTRVPENVKRALAPVVAAFVDALYNTYLYTLPVRMQGGAMTGRVRTLANRPTSAVVPVRITNAAPRVRVTGAQMLKASEAQAIAQGRKAPRDSGAALAPVFEAAQEPRKSFVVVNSGRKSKLPPMLQISRDQWKLHEVTMFDKLISLWGTEPFIEIPRHVFYGLDFIMQFEEHRGIKHKKSSRSK